MKFKSTVKSTFKNSNLKSRVNYRTYPFVQKRSIANGPTCQSASQLPRPGHVFFYGLWSKLTRPNNSCGVVLSKPSPLRSLPAPLVCSPSCLRSFGRVNTSPPEPSLSPPQAPVLKRRYLPGIPRIPTQAELTHHLAAVSIMVGSCTERNVTVNPTYGFDLNPSV